MIPRRFKLPTVSVGTAGMFVVLLLAFSAFTLVSTVAEPPTAASLKNGLRRIHRSDETESIRITAEMDRVVRLGGPIVVELRLINNRDQVILCPHDRAERDFNLRLFNNEDELVPASELGRIFMDPYTFQSNVGLRLVPGETIVRHYDLSKYFKIKKPGHYKLNVLKIVGPVEGFDDGADLNVVADGIGFTVRK